MKISSAAPPWGTLLKTHYWGLKREEQSPVPSGNRTPDLKSFALLGSAHPLCYHSLLLFVTLKIFSLNLKCFWNQLQQSIEILLDLLTASCGTRYLNWQDEKTFWSIKMVCNHFIRNDELPAKTNAYFSSSGSSCLRSWTTLPTTRPSSGPAAGWSSSWLNRKRWDPKMAGLVQDKKLGCFGL